MPRSLGAPGLDENQTRNVVRAIGAIYDECHQNATEVGRRLGISQTAVSEIIHGRNRPSFQTAEKVAKVTGTPVWLLLGGERVATPSTHPVLHATIAYLGDRAHPEAVERVRAAAAHLPDLSQSTWASLLLDRAHTTPSSSKPPMPEERTFVPQKKR